MKFQEEIKVAQQNCSDSTSAKVSAGGPDDDSQQGPEHIEARLPADRSSVAGCNIADLERDTTTDELEKKRKRA